MRIIHFWTSGVGHIRAQVGRREGRQAAADVNCSRFISHGRPESKLQHLCPEWRMTDSTTMSECNRTSHGIRSGFAPSASWPKKSADSTSLHRKIWKSSMMQCPLKKVIYPAIVGAAFCYPNIFRLLALFTLLGQIYFWSNPMTFGLNQICEWKKVQKNQENKCI